MDTSIITFKYILSSLLKYVFKKLYIPFQYTLPISPYLKFEYPPTDHQDLEDGKQCQ